MNVLSIAKEKTMKRAEIVAARKQCKDEIANILASIRSLSAVPQRVINGSHGMASITRTRSSPQSARQNISLIGGRCEN